MRLQGDKFQSARKRLLGQLGSRFLPAIVTRVVDASLLASTPFFAGLDAAAVETVAGFCQSRELKRNDILFREGEEANELFVVQRGRIAIANRSEDGRESLVALMESGDLFGEMGLFDGIRSADARALETSTVVAVPYAPLRRPSTASRARCGASSSCSPGGSAPSTRRWPTPCSSTSRAAPRSACSSWPATATSSSCRSPRRSWRRWSARRASA